MDGAPKTSKDDAASSGGDSVGGVGGGSPLATATTAGCLLRGALSPPVQRKNCSSPSSPNPAPSDSDSGCLLEDYSWTPPGMTGDSIQAYFGQIPRHKVPLLNSSGERYRVRQIIHQLPPQDFDPRFCSLLSPDEEEEMRKFMDYRKRYCLGQGVVRTVQAPQEEGLACELCSKSITDGLAVFSPHFPSGVGWHPSCFCCCVCKELLVDLVYCVSDNMLFCERHYAEIIKPRCATCDELIFSDECTEAESRNWHHEHFRCFKCEQVMGGQKYIMRNGWPFCVRCYDDVFSKVCRSCGTTVKVDQGRSAPSPRPHAFPLPITEGEVSHEGRHWHASRACFHCHSCFCSLVGRPFLLADDVVFCSLHCKREEERKDTASCAGGSQGVWGNGSDSACSQRRRGRRRGRDPPEAAAVESRGAPPPPPLPPPNALSKSSSDCSLGSSASSLLRWAHNMYEDLKSTLKDAPSSKSSLCEDGGTVGAASSTPRLGRRRQLSKSATDCQRFPVGRSPSSSLPCSRAPSRSDKSSDLYESSGQLCASEEERGASFPREEYLERQKSSGSFLRKSSTLRSIEGPSRGQNASLRNLTSTNSWRWINFEKKGKGRGGSIRDGSFVYDNFQSLRARKTEEIVEGHSAGRKVLAVPCEGNWQQESAGTDVTTQPVAAVQRNAKGTVAHPQQQQPPESVPGVDPDEVHGVTESPPSSAPAGVAAEQAGRNPPGNAPPFPEGVPPRLPKPLHEFRPLASRPALQALDPLDKKLMVESLRHFPVVQYVYADSELPRKHLQTPHSNSLMMRILKSDNKDKCIIC